jgi:hypothetical protein
MKNLKITISGEICTGKSTLASILQEKLTEMGYKIILLPTDDKSPKKVGDYIKELAKETTVVVEEITIKHLPVENSNVFFDIKDAFYVTKEEIKPIKAFELKESTHSGYNTVIYASTDTGWSKKSNYSGNLHYYNDVSWTIEDAKKLQNAKLDEHLKYLELQQSKNLDEIATIKAKLNNKN